MMNRRRRKRTLDTWNLVRLLGRISGAAAFGFGELHCRRRRRLRQSQMVAYQLAEVLGVENSSLQTLRLIIRCINVELWGPMRAMVGTRTEGRIDDERMERARAMPVQGASFPKIGRVLEEKRGGTSETSEDVLGWKPGSRR